MKFLKENYYIKLWKTNTICHTYRERHVVWLGKGALGRIQSESIEGKVGA